MSRVGTKMESLASFEGPGTPDGYRQSKLTSAFENISTLLADLEEKEMNQSDVSLLKSNVDDLMTQFSDNHADLLTDLTSILESLKMGLMTPDQLESLVRAEQDRSTFILKMAAMIKANLEHLFENFQTVLGYVETGQPLPMGSMDSMAADLNLALDSVDSIQRIINTPGKRLSTTINEVEKDIARATAKAAAESQAQRKLEASRQDGVHFSSSKVGAGDQKRNALATNIQGEKVASPLPKSLKSFASFSSNAASAVPSPFDFNDDVASNRRSAASSRHGVITAEKSSQTDESPNDSKPELNILLGGKHVQESLMTDDFDAKHDTKPKKSHATKSKGKSKGAHGGSSVNDGMDSYIKSHGNASGLNEISRPSTSGSEDMMTRSDGVQAMNVSAAGLTQMGSRPPESSTSDGSILLTKASAGASTQSAIGRANPIDADLSSGGSKVWVTRTAPSSSPRQAATGMSTTNGVGGSSVGSTGSNNNITGRKHSPKLVRSGNSTPTRRQSPQLPDLPASLLDIDIQPSADDDEVVCKLKERLRYLEEVLSQYKERLLQQDDSANGSNKHGLEAAARKGIEKRKAGAARGASASDEEDFLLAAMSARIEGLGSSLDSVMGESDNSIGAGNLSSAHDPLHALSVQGSGFVALHSLQDSSYHPNTSYITSVSARVSKLEPSADIYLNSQDVVDSIEIFAAQPGTADSSKLGRVGQDAVASESHAGAPTSLQKGKGDFFIMLKPPSANQGTCTDDLAAHIANSLSSGPSAPVAGKVVKVTVPASAGTQLPIVSEIGGMITRTYKVSTERNFRSDLRKSSNPLLTLLEEYKDMLPPVLKTRLLCAAAGGVAADAKAIASSSGTESMTTPLQTLFAAILPSLEELDGICLQSLIEVEGCEKMVEVLIALKQTDDQYSGIYKKSVEKLYSKFGECAAIKLLIEIQLGEHRRIFEEINAQSLQALPKLIKSCPEFGKSYDHFVSCQGRLVELKNRLELSRDRSARYKIVESFAHAQAARDAAFGRQSSVSPHRLVPSSGAGPDSMSVPGTANATAGFESVSWRDYTTLQEYAMQLQSGLEAAMGEIDDLKVELFQAEQDHDRTPGALLFFATLHDGSTVSALQQLELQLTNLKGFASCTEHVDFATLRKRLNVCISTVPVIERFVKRYSNLHSRWTKGRLVVFNNRNLTGGDADGSHTCPLCSTDNRVSTALTTGAAAVAANSPVRASAGRARTTSQKDRIPRTAATVGSSSQKLLLGIGRAATAFPSLNADITPQTRADQTRADLLARQKSPVEMTLVQSESLPLLQRQASSGRN